MNSPQEPSICLAPYFEYCQTNPDDKQTWILKTNRQTPENNYEIKLNRGKS
jgi:hypothetical protein